MMKRSERKLAPMRGSDADSSNVVLQRKAIESLDVIANIRIKGDMPPRILDADGDVKSLLSLLNERNPQSRLLIGDVAERLGWSAVRTAETLSRAATAGWLRFSKHASGGTLVELLEKEMPKI